MKKTISLVLVLALGLAVEVANADFTFGEPVNLGPTVNTLYGEGGQTISADGLTLYFGEFPDNADPSGYGGGDIWVTMRNTINDAWGSRTNLGPTVNTSSDEAVPCMSTDGLSLYFASNRAGGYGSWDLWMTTRETTSDPWGQPMNLGPTVNSSADETQSSISADGLELYFSDFLAPRPGGYGSADLWVTKRPTKDDPWGTPVNLGDTVNGWYYDGEPFISADSLTLFFKSWRAGGVGAGDMWMTRRATTDSPWTKPVNLGPTVNSSADEVCPSFSANGSTLYFGSDRSGGSGGWDLWQASVIPIVDFNGDGIVDCADMCIIVDHWHTDYQLCDIGPMPWGDGIVDVQDLIVIAEHLFEVYPSAETVEVNEDNDGGQIELELDKLLVVTLASNPSTGYKWELVENNESILKQFGEVEFKSSQTGEPPIVGAGGWEIFHFKAISAGQMTLQLVYRRSWEEGVEPINTFSIEVVVR